MDKVATAENNATGNLHKPPVKSSFRKETFLSVKCSQCGEMFCQTDNLYDLFETKKEALQQLKEYDWTVKGNIALCENCS